MESQANVCTLRSSRKELYLTFFDLAEGTLFEADLTTWLEQHALSFELPR
ncbi:MAG: hypothetical protein NVS9B15_11640 [Acidobacteriaceae bacterium]